MCCIEGKKIQRVLEIDKQTIKSRSLKHPQLKPHQLSQQDFFSMIKSRCCQRQFTMLPWLSILMAVPSGWSAHVCWIIPGGQVAWIGNCLRHQLLLQSKLSTPTEFPRFSVFTRLLNRSFEKKKDNIFICTARFWLQTSLSLEVCQPVWMRIGRSHADYRISTDTSRWAFFQLNEKRSLHPFSCPLVQNKHYVDACSCPLNLSPYSQEHKHIKNPNKIRKEDLTNSCIGAGGHFHFFYFYLFSFGHSTDLLVNFCNPDRIWAKRRHATLLVCQHAVQVSHLCPILGIPQQRHRFPNEQTIKTKFSILTVIHPA